MKKETRFECLRCEHRFAVDHDPKVMVERACPACGSNSVRPAPAAKAESGSKKGQGH